MTSLIRAVGSSSTSGYPSRLLRIGFLLLISLTVENPLLAQSPNVPQSQHQILLVQKVGFTSDTTKTVVADYQSDNIAGNLLVAFVGSIGIDGDDVTGLTDSQGNVWFRAGRSTHNISIWYAQNCKGGANTVSLSKSGSVSRGFLAIAEYSGAAQTGVVLDQTNFGFEKTTTEATDQILLGYPGALVVSMFDSTSKAVDWSNVTAGYTIEAGAASSFTAWADNLSSAQGQNSFQVTSSAPDALELKMAAFLPSQLPAPAPGYNFIRTCESLNKTLSPDPGSPSQCSFPGGNSAGDLVLVVCNQFFPVADQITSVTDTAGNTYGKLFSRFDGFLRTFTDVYAVNGSAGTNLGNTISCNFTADGVQDSVDVVAIEYSGQASENILDTSAFSSATTEDSLSYSITPAQVGDLLFSVNVTNSGPNTWSGLGIETDREPSLGDSNNETRIADLLSAPSGTSTITVTRGDVGLAGFTLALRPSSDTVPPSRQPSILSAQITPSPIDQLGSFTINSTILGSSGLPNPTGTLSIKFEAANYSSVSTVELGSGPVTFSANNFPIGLASVEVIYGGDSNYQPANIAVPLSITEPFVVTGTPATIAAAGATSNNTSTFTVSPAGGFVGSVNVTCSLSTSNLPLGAQFVPTCAVPSSINISGAKAVSSIITISSTASAVSSAAVFGRLSTPATTADILIGLLFGLGLLIISSKQVRSIQYPPALRGSSLTLMLLFVLLLGVSLAGCTTSGSSGTHGGIGGSENVGTTPGVYTFVVVATVPGPNHSVLFSANANVPVTIQ